MGTDWSPVGQIYFFTLQSTNPQYDVMELKSLEDWVVEKNLKSVPDIVDVASFGGPTREYQVRLDPNKLVAYGLSLAQVEQQLTNNNANAGGSFIEAGLQQINIREVGLVERPRHRATPSSLPRPARRCASRISAMVDAGAEDSARPIRARAIPSAKTARSSTTTMWSPASCCCAKAPTADPALQGCTTKVKEMNDHILPQGVKIVPFIDRSDLVHFTTTPFCTT